MPIFANVLEEFNNLVVDNPAPAAEERLHNYSVTPLELLPWRLAYYRQKANHNPDPEEVIIDGGVDILDATPRLHNAMWGIDQVAMNERAEAAAILESVTDRWLLNEANEEVMPRWCADDEKFSGRVYDRKWGVETARLIPWRYSLAGYNGPSLVYDVLFGMVRTIEMYDTMRFRDAEDIGVWEREMRISRISRIYGVEAGFEDEEEEDEEEDLEDEDEMDEGSESDEEEESEESEESDEDDESDEYEESDEDEEAEESDEDEVMEDL